MGFFLLVITEYMCFFKRSMRIVIIFLLVMAGVNWYLGVWEEDAGGTCLGAIFPDGESRADAFSENGITARCPRESGGLPRTHPILLRPGRGEALGQYLLNKHHHYLNIHFSGRNNRVKTWTVLSTPINHRIHNYLIYSLRSSICILQYTFFAPHCLSMNTEEGSYKLHIN